MRFITVRIGWALRITGLGVTMAAAASSCVPVERNTVEVARVKFDTVGIQPVALPQFTRADPEEVAERGSIGGALGAMLGAGLGATASIDPALGAAVGGPAGAAIGVVVGIATVQPLPSYAPIAVPAAPVIPGFYDTWPPGYAAPPAGAQASPPPPDWYAPLAEKTVPDEAPLPASEPVPPPAPL
jgi:hypothetical protein